MHTHNLDVDISLEELTKIEGAASCDIKIRDGKVEECKFGITEMRRFFEEAIRGKPIAAVPSQVARVCGTCSNAHLLASTLAIENALDLKVSDQATLLRKLLNYGLVIRDHALHLYVFALPDLFNKNSILDFDENDEIEHQFLDDTFLVKDAGNKLGVVVGGRSVHAPFVRLGGFSQIPQKEKLTELIPVLQNTREAVRRLIKIYQDYKFPLVKDGLEFISLVSPDYSFLDGQLKTSSGESISFDQYESRLSRKDIGHSQAEGFRFDGKTYMVGALARIMMAENSLHKETRNDAKEALDIFPSIDIFHNNLAQAIEILHAIDSSIELINKYEAKEEALPEIHPRDSVGYGIIEAPRGTLFHKIEIGQDGLVKKGRIIVPTGQNQIGIEEIIKIYVENHLDESKEELEKHIEMIVRAYDPCMSCATHFLKLKIT